MVLVELVVEQRPVVLSLDLLSSLPQGDRSLGHDVFLLLGAKSCPPVDEGLLQFVDPSLGESLGGGGGRFTFKLLKIVILKWQP